MDDWGEKRQRAAAVQNLADVRSGPVNAKRLGVRQPSGALERGNGQIRMPQGQLVAPKSDESGRGAGLAL